MTEDGRSGRETTPMPRFPFRFPHLSRWFWAGSLWSAPRRGNAAQF